MREWKYRAALQEDGMRLEQILKAHGFSKKEISRLKFRAEGMTADGVRKRSTDIIRCGEQIVLRLGDDPCPGREESGAEEPMAEENGLREFFSSRIVYEDSDLLIVNKPSGISCHPGKGHYTCNLGTLLCSFLKDRGEKCAIRLIGRLDLDTSGAVVFARNQAAAARLWEQRKKGDLRKSYLAAVHGTFTEKEGTIRLPIAPRAGEKNRMEVREDGQRAATHYRALGCSDYRGMPITLVQCRLETGRTHQIRVHMNALGHPVLGDPFYGIADGAPQLALHAFSVSLFQPFSLEPVDRILPPDAGTVLEPFWKLSEKFFEKSTIIL